MGHYIHPPKYFSAMYFDSGPTVRMGDDLEIQAKGIGGIDLEDGYFNNVLYVLDLETNLLLNLSYASHR